MIDYVSVAGDWVKYSYKPGIKLAVSTMSELSNNDAKEDTDSMTFEINAPENLEAWLSDRFMKAGATEEDRLGWFNEIDSNVDEAKNEGAIKALVEYRFSKYIPSVISQNDLEDQDYRSVVLLVALVYAITRRDGEAEVVISAR